MGSSSWLKGTKSYSSPGIIIPNHKVEAFVSRVVLIEAHINFAPRSPPHLSISQPVLEPWPICVIPKKNHYSKWLSISSSWMHWSYSKAHSLKGQEHNNDFLRPWMIGHHPGPAVIQNLKSMSQKEDLKSLQECIYTCKFSLLQLL